ncbi:MAG: hypothetical protein RMJ98_14070 [Myxococcales bacterium]|nr:protein bicaudal D homolog [Polyangiaceae bacterium]MDW8250418.1 hypothetical protein [Myxococcales bacterium]
MNAWYPCASLALSIVLLACGTSKGAPPSTPSASGAGEPPPAPPPAAHTQPAAPSEVSSPFASPPPIAGGPIPESWPREMQILGAMLTLENEMRQLQGALSSCDAACRSLASMERAVKIVCSLAQGEEQARCEEARKRLREARLRVREACKVCQDGTTTDPDAPG